MASDLWTYLHHVGHASLGVTQRGPHDPAIPVSGYNLGHTDHADHDAVDALRGRARLELGVPDAPMVLAEQVHGNRVAVVRATDLAALPRRHSYPYYPGADALITSETNLALTLFYADCCPMILYSMEKRCGGVIHAGWRGTVADIAGATVRALAEQYGVSPIELRALVGPCIGTECYEVGPEVIEAVEALGLPQTAMASRAGISPAPCVQRHGESTHLDLLALNVLLLQRAGVAESNIEAFPACTRCGPVPLFSWRRDGPTTGRLAALLVLHP